MIVQHFKHEDVLEVLGSVSVSEYPSGHQVPLTEAEFLNSSTREPVAEKVEDLGVLLNDGRVVVLVKKIGYT
jgi:hypothetical protein